MFEEQKILQSIDFFCAINFHSAMRFVQWITKVIARDECDIITKEIYNVKSSIEFK